ncbi:hypothetical protein BASA50_002253 [Batrachochytrium salamandrivorans]|uniref:Transmembrane protein n=1 Tax=Batrachochytrium salamandrivorans TaxID=1357716 RepID=A0ABQ8FLU8_9FUNG|nr:hypothetical protein BASA62_000012 [Batrachochytrium salamandrivorans]KAH6560298.1 hypothetical protein BASA60_000011 [Batrachochytrium salamandrivorans]KAH6600508.1 hypothetical protein BASA50_002253 [Batrachochytrium salamandrivorans]KAH9264882.1 hypothetical protein BASA83_011629 [Batrachochytrium salamandrivorans]
MRTSHDNGRLFMTANVSAAAALTLALLSLMTPVMIITNTRTSESDHIGLISECNPSTSTCQPTCHLSMGSNKMCESLGIARQCAYTAGVSFLLYWIVVAAFYRCFLGQTRLQRYMRSLTIAITVTSFVTLVMTSAFIVNAHNSVIAITKSNHSEYIAAYGVYYGYGVYMPILSAGATVLSAILFRFAIKTSIYSPLPSSSTPEK